MKRMKAKACAAAIKFATSAEFEWEKDEDDDAPSYVDVVKMDEVEDTAAALLPPPPPPPLPPATFKMKFEDFPVLARGSRKCRRNERQTICPACNCLNEEDGDENAAAYTSNEEDIVIAAGNGSEDVDEADDFDDADDTDDSNDSDDGDDVDDADDADDEAESVDEWINVSIDSFLESDSDPNSPYHGTLGWPYDNSVNNVDTEGQLDASTPNSSDGHDEDVFGLRTLARTLQNSPMEWYQRAILDWNLKPDFDLLENNFSVRFFGPLLPHEVPRNLPYGSCYTNFPNKETLLIPRMRQMGEDLLFFYFYNYPQDMMQMLAAATLVERGWRYHMDKLVWLRRQDDNPDYVITNEFESGEYNYFNTIVWKILPKKFYIRHGQLENTLTVAELKDLYGYHQQMD